MKKFILASASPQRKTLLKKIGLKFKVLPAKVAEKDFITKDIAALVKHNALIKAKDVCAQVKNGIVIAADTIVYGRDQKIIGKPKDLVEAKRVLKKLIVKPHWVYTGVVVMDAKTKKRVVDFEKTKVFMKPLSDEEIDNYYKHMSPLDKAGGFDIEGKGGSFIHRIEGCYSNVIGLPLAKLRLMLKKLGVSILSLLVISTFIGCASEYNLATQQEESLMYGTEKEISLGDALARQFEEHYKLVPDLDLNERVDKILERITAVCDRKELLYSIKIVDEDELNAVSLPGGYVYIFKGILDKAKTDDQLAGVIAHEVGHITARHSIKKLQAIYGYTLLQALSIATRNPNVVQGVNAAYTSVFLEFSQQDEFQADKLGVKYMKKAGYNVDEMVNMLKILKAEQDKGPIKSFSYWRTHPHLSERISAANSEATGKLNYKDYLNLTGSQ